MRPADGRLRGQDFEGQVTEVAWPDQAIVNGRTVEAVKGHRFVVFTLELAEDTAAISPRGSDLAVTASVRWGHSSQPLSLSGLNDNLGPAGRGLHLAERHPAVRGQRARHFAHRCSGAVSGLSTAIQNSQLAAIGIPQGRPRDFPTNGHGIPHSVQLARGTTPLPEVASMSRTDSPSVTMTWAWCKSRSTRADAIVLSMS